MRTIPVLFASVLLLPAAPAAAQSAPSNVQGPEIVAAIQVHGNTITSVDEVVEASGISVGDVVSDKLMAEAEARLRTAIKPDSVEVLKRYASISDATKVLILIQVDEGPVRVEVPDIDVPAPKIPGPGISRPTVVRRSHFNMMWVPIVSAEDGYGLTYGAQLAFSGHRSMQRRVVVPASWGGDKRVAVEYQQEFRPRFAPRLRTGALVQRRTHPFFREAADRTRLWGRTEWPLLRNLQAGTEIAWQSSSLVGETVKARSIGADAVFDTRIDPLMPYNAVFVRSAVERLSFSGNGSAIRTDVDANAYVGLYRGAVLALRAAHEGFSRPAPSLYKAILGGSRNLRGFRAGRAVGDTLAAGSVELRIPATSPLRLARFGYSIFMDIAATYDNGRRLEDQRFEKGAGAGVWMTAPLFQASVAVARGIGAGTRVHIGAGLTF